jgi:hypothetical protein
MDSCATIVADAAAIAKARGMISQAGRFLQSTLNDLALHRNLKILLANTPIVLQPGTFGPYNLPSNYRRYYSFTYQLLGYPYKLDEISLEDFDLLSQSSILGGQPDSFATDLSGYSAVPAMPGLLQVYPQPSGIINTTFRYFQKVAEMAAPLETNAAVPWFEDQEYLRVDVARQLMQPTDDDRYQTYVAEAERLLEKHLLTEGDEQRLTHSIRLDPTKFRFGARLKPTKASPF